MGYRKNSGFDLLFILIWVLIGLTVWLGFLATGLITIGGFLLLYFYLSGLENKSTTNYISDKKIDIPKKFKEEIPVIKRIRSLGVIGNLMFLGILIIFGFLFYFMPINLGWIRVVLAFLTLVVLCMWFDI